MTSREGSPGFNPFSSVDNTWGRACFVRRDRKGKREYVHTLQNAKGECYGADYMVNGAFVEVFDDYDSFYEQIDVRQYHGLLKGVQFAFVTTGSVDFITDDEKVCVLWFQQRKGRPFTSKKDEPIVAFPMKGLLEDETGEQWLRGSTSKGRASGCQLCLAAAAVELVNVRVTPPTVAPPPCPPPPPQTFLGGPNHWQIRMFPEFPETLRNGGLKLRSTSLACMIW